MVIAIVLLSILFLLGFLNTLLHISPKKLLAHLHHLLLSSTSSPSSTMTTKQSCVTTPLEAKKGPLELESVFTTFDKNGDGFITKQELGESLKNMGLFSSEKEVGSMVEKLDVNGDGLIDLDEFRDMYGSMGEGEKGGEDEEEEELREAFGVFDGDKDGLISVEELSSVLGSLGIKKGIRSEDCKEMIKKVDLDGDGMVNFDEFKCMMKNGGNLVSIS